MSLQQPSSGRNIEFSMSSSSHGSNVRRGGGRPYRPVDPTLDVPSLPVQPSPPRRTHSDTSSSSRPQYHPHRENDLPSLPTPDMSTEARRQSMMAMDRKRRLTASAYDTGRRRPTAGGFTSRENRSHIPATRHPPPAQEDLHEDVRQPEVIDLTSTSPPVEHAPLPPRPPTRRTSNNSRNYVVPRWQRDSEVSECPICHRQFTMWFRRHHCRKCGRVVCNECSPHRITIPRQYIVQPPGYDEAPLPGSRPSPMTSDTDSYLAHLFNESRRLNSESRNFSSSFVGGEKVRLCNPCVPDPQPENQTFFEQSPRLTPEQPSNPSLFFNLPATLPVPPQRQTSYRNQSQAQQSQSHARVSFSTNSDNEDSGSSPEAYTSVPRHHIMQALASHRPHPAFGQTHSRYYSLDANRGPLPPLPPPLGNRARVYSGPQQFGTSGITLSYGGPQRPSHYQSSSTPSVQHLPRRRIREEDMCPICRGALPPKGPEGDESDREAHIMDCISRHDPSASPLSARQRNSVQTETLESALSSSLQIPTTSTSMPSSSVPPTRVVPAQMLRFTATEKDCIAVSVPGEDEPQPQECSICMVEYEVGDQLARLECWCKFHQECIAEWFGRKRECPVHKIS